MYISQEEFNYKFYNKLKVDQEFFNELIINIIENPFRYIGPFRATNAKTKLIQNITQSREIKFGNFLEDILTEYISIMGYTNLNKNILSSENNKKLNNDQLFSKDNIIYLIEQKVRDDHDSTKKSGQINNLFNKVETLKTIYPNSEIVSSMWFIDSRFKKNFNYYLSEIKNRNIPINLYYGEEIFSNLFNRLDIWEEFIFHLEYIKNNSSNEVLNIPDFDTSEEIFLALQNLYNLSMMDNKTLKDLGYKPSVKKLYAKLISDDPIYQSLRKELFPNNINLKRIGELL